MGYRFNSKYFTNQKRNIRENIWYKLYMLQNYNITTNMFKGATMRWSSIQCYLNMIRRITEGEVDEFYNKSVVTPSLIKYIKGLIDSGIEPYKKENGDIQELVKKGILNNAQVDYIFSSVGVSNGEVDTSHGSSRCSHEKKSYGRNYGEYSDLDNENTITNTAVEKNEITIFTSRYKLNHTTPLWASKPTVTTTKRWGSW